MFVLTKVNGGLTPASSPRSRRQRTVVLVNLLRLATLHVGAEARRLAGDVRARVPAAIAAS